MSVELLEKIDQIDYAAVVFLVIGDIPKVLLVLILYYHGPCNFFRINIFNFLN